MEINIRNQVLIKIELQFYSKLDGINIVPWNSGSPLDYGSLGNYGSYMSGSLSLDVSPTELKSMSAYPGGNNYSSQFSSASPATPGGSSWYSPSDGNIHVLHTGEILRKVEPGQLPNYSLCH